MQKLSWKKRIVFYSLLVLIPLLTIELGFRVLAAARVGPGAFLYGTRWARDTKQAAPTPVKKARTTKQHKNIVETASGKYSVVSTSVCEIAGEGLELAEA